MEDLPHSKECSKVNSLHRWPTLVACVSTVIWSLVPLVAQAQQRNPQLRNPQPRNPQQHNVRPANVVPMQQGGDRIAVIDINHIFKNHARFKQMVEDWKNDVKGAEAKMKGENGRIQTMMEELKRFNPGSPEFKALEEKIAKERAGLQVKMQIEKRNLMSREAKMYLNIYKEVQEQVAYFARQKGITLVLRFTSGQVNSEDPRQIQNALLRPVVFQDRIDITQEILSRLNPPAGVAIPPRGSRNSLNNRIPQSPRR